MQPGEDDAAPPPPRVNRAGAARAVRAGAAGGAGQPEGKKTGADPAAARKAAATKAATNRAATNKAAANRAPARKAAANRAAANEAAATKAGGRKEAPAAPVEEAAATKAGGRKEAPAAPVEEAAAAAPPKRTAAKKAGTKEAGTKEAGTKKPGTKKPAIKKAGTEKAQTEKAQTEKAQPNEPVLEKAGAKTALPARPQPGRAVRQRVVPQRVVSREAGPKRAGNATVAGPGPTGPAIVRRPPEITASPGASLARQARLQRTVKRMRRVITALLVLAVCGFLIDGASRPADPRLVPAADPGAPAGAPAMGTATLSVVGRPKAACVLEAVTARQQSFGLMDRRSVAPYAGMAFVFAAPTQERFHMLDTLIPLSIAWFDGAGHFLAEATMPPCPKGTSACPTYGPGRPYMEAVEVPAGGLAALGIGPGSTVQLGGACT